MYYAGDLRKIEMKGVGRVRKAVDRAREEGLTGAADTPTHACLSPEASQLNFAVH